MAGHKAVGERSNSRMVLSDVMRTSVGRSPVGKASLDQTRPMRPSIALMKAPAQGCRESNESYDGSVLLFHRVRARDRDRKDGGQREGGGATG